MNRKVITVALASAFLLALLLLFFGSWARPQARDPVEPGSHADNTGVLQAQPGAEIARSSVPDDSPRAADEPPPSEVLTISGILKFPTGAFSLKDVRVLVNVPILLRMDAAGSSEFAPNENGTFQFWLPEGVEKVKLSARGGGSFAGEDIEAAAGDLVEIQLGFLYCADIQPIDAVSGERVSDKLNLHARKDGTVYRYLDDCRPGVWSELLWDEVLGSLPPRRPSPATRHVLWSPDYLPGGIRVSITIASQEVQSTRTVLQIPLFKGVLPTIDWPVEVSDVPHFVIDLNVTREGDWSQLGILDYRSLAQLRCSSVRSGLGPFFAEASLSPGIHELRGVKLEDPVLELEYAASLQYGWRDPLRKVRLELSPVKGAEGKYRATLDARQVCAVWVAPIAKPEAEQAWFGFQLANDQADAGSYSYSASNGFMIDGLMPGKYCLFWGKNFADYQRVTNSRLPVEVVELRPGPHQVILP